MKALDLKIKPCFFNEVINGKKTFELRYDDRGYEEGDILILREFDGYDGDYSGHIAIVEVTSILKGYDGLRDGFVIMSTKLLWSCIKNNQKL